MAEAIILTEEEEAKLDLFEDRLSTLMKIDWDIKNRGDEMIFERISSRNKRLYMLVGITATVGILAAISPLFNPWLLVPPIFLIFLSMVLELSLTIPLVIEKFNDFKELVKKLEYEYLDYIKSAREFVAEISNRARGNAILLKNNGFKAPKTGFLMANINNMPVKYRMDTLVEDLGIGTLSDRYKKQLIVLLVSDLATPLLHIPLVVYMMFSIDTSSV